MVLPEPSYANPRPEEFNTDEVQGNYFKNNFMMMIEVFKKEMKKKSLKKLSKRQKICK